MGNSRGCLMTVALKNETEINNQSSFSLIFVNICKWGSASTDKLINSNVKILIIILANIAIIFFMFIRVDYLAQNHKGSKNPLESLKNENTKWILVKQYNRKKRPEKASSPVKTQQSTKTWWLAQESMQKIKN